MRKPELDLRIFCYSLRMTLYHIFRFFSSFFESFFPEKTKKALFRPYEILYSGSGFEVIFCYSEVDFRIESASGFRGNSVSVEREHEFLLIHRGRSEQNGFYSAPEPIGRGDCVRNRVGRLAFMRDSRSRAVAQSYHAVKLFVLSDGEGGSDFFVGKSHPEQVLSPISCAARTIFSP